MSHNGTRLNLCAHIIDSGGEAEIFSLKTAATNLFQSRVYRSNSAMPTFGPEVWPKNESRNGMARAVQMVHLKVTF